MSPYVHGGLGKWRKIKGRCKLKDIGKTLGINGQKDPKYLSSYSRT